MRFKPHLTVKILVLCLMTGSGAAAEDRQFLLPDLEIMTRLRTGEIVLENGSADQNGAAASILIFIQAPVERIWATIINCEDARAFLAGLKYCRVIEERGDYALTYQIVDKGWLTPKLDYTFETERELYQHMEFRLIKGNLKTLKGSWDFEVFADGVLVRHVMVLRPKVLVPRWLVRLNMKRDLPGMMSCIRGLSEGSGSEQAIRADIEKCPGEIR